MRDLGAAWLGGDERPCLTRDRWDGRIKDVGAHPDAEDEWWFTATMIPCDGIGSPCTQEFYISDIREDDRAAVKVGAVVKTICETVTGGYGVRRFAVRVLPDPDERGLWEKT